MTTADHIADLYDNDGQKFFDANDIPILETLDQSPACCEAHNEHMLYTFADGSIIVVNESYWDILTKEDGPEGQGLYSSSGDLYVQTISGTIDWCTAE